MKIRILFDMDETLFNLSHDPLWLAKLRQYDASPYENAPPMVRMSALAKRLNHLQKLGYEIGIVSWLSKESTPEYDADVTAAKLASLDVHLHSVNWDIIEIVPYGTPKEQFCQTAFDVLFDDNADNRARWKGRAYDVDDILGDLERIKRQAPYDLLFADWFPV